MIMCYDPLLPEFSHIYFILLEYKQGMQYILCLYYASSFYCLIDGVWTVSTFSFLQRFGPAQAFIRRFWVVSVSWGQARWFILNANNAKISRNQVHYLAWEHALFNSDYPKHAHYIMNWWVFLFVWRSWAPCLLSWGSPFVCPSSNICSR